jgi:hypothetical protein
MYPRDASLPPTSLISPDDPEPDVDAWADWCAAAKQIDRARVLESVLGALDSDTSPLYDLIDPAIQCPHEPGRPRESIIVLAAVGQKILQLVASATEEQINLRLAGKVV